MRKESAIKQTALFNSHERNGASLIEHHGWQVPASFLAPEEEVGRVRGSVGLADISWMPKLDLKGYGLKTLPALGDGAFLWALGPLHYLVTCDSARQGQVMDQLTKLGTAPADLSLPPAVYVTDITSVYAQFLLAGPQCREVLSKLTSLNVSQKAFPDLSCRQSSLAHVHAIILRQDIGQTLAYCLLISRDYAESVWDSIVHAGNEYGLTPFGVKALELLGA